MAILAALAAAQLAIHLVLTVAATCADQPAAAGDGWLMLVTHGVAVALTAGLLTRAETALFVLAAVLVVLLPRRVRGCPVPGAAPVRPIVPAATVPVDRRLAVLRGRVCVRRGPPVRC